MNEQIIVKCKQRGYLVARVNAMPNGIVIDRGEMVAGRFTTYNDLERLPFDENPEIEGVYDHKLQAWDVDKLYALLHDCCEELSA